MQRNELERGKPQTTKMTLDEFKTGDPKAFRAVLPILIRFANRYMNGNFAGAEDLVQTAMANVVGPFSRKSPEDFVETNGNVVPYIKRAIVNTRINQVRGEGRLPQVVTSTEEVSDGFVRDHAQNVEELVIAEMDGDTTLARLKGHVNDVFVEALYLAEVDGLSYKEIAERQNTAFGTVKSRINRGKSDARKVLQGTD